MKMRKVWASLAFESVYGFASRLIMIPLFQFLFLGILRLADFAYITNKNLLSFLSSPIAVVSLSGFALLVSAYALVNIIALLGIWNGEYRSINLNSIFSFVFKKIKRLFSFKNIGIVFWVLLVVPFFHLGLISEVITKVRIPPYWLETLQTIWWAKLLLVLGIVLIVGLFLKTVFVFHFFFLKEVSFFRALQESWRLTRHRLLVLGGSLFGVQLLYSLCLDIFFRMLPLRLDWFGFICLAAFFSSLIVPINYALLSYWYQKWENDRVVVLCKKESGSQKLMYCVFFFGCVVGYGIHTQSLFSWRPIEIIAHRGDSLHHTENTLAAFEGANVLGADAIELDVRQSKDGVLVVSHDSSFKRLGGDSRKIKEMTSKEIEEIRLGKEKVATLRETLALAKKKRLFLILEIKPKGNNEGLVRSLVKMIRDYDFEDECMVTSFNTKELEMVKKLDKKIETLALFTFAYGDVASIPYVDAFSVEESTITPELVHSIHEEGKKIFAWTPSTQPNIERMVRLGVDGLITDQIELAQKIRREWSALF